jgi:hypothetical protein
MAPVRRRAILAAILCLAVVAVGAGCEEPPEDAAMTDGLLVLSGDVGSVTLRVREGGRGRRIELPDPATSWVAAGRTNVLLATLVDGRTYVSNPLGDEDPEWRLVEPVTLTDQPPEPPLFFGTWDPPGAAYAQLGSDFAEGGGMRAVVVDPGLEQAVEVAVTDSQAAPAPAAWIDDDRLVIVSTAGDDGEAVIVDSATQEVQQGPAGVRLVGTSADASMAAVWRSGGEPIDIQSTESWLAEQPASIRIDVPDDAAGPGVMALDAEGERLAVVWTDGEGNPIGIAVYAAASSWGRVASLELGEAAAATVAWLR